MIRPLAASVALVLVMGFNTIAPAIAAPPTAVPSPGYDRRLVESRRALGGYSSYDDRTVVVAPRGHHRYDRRHGRPRHPY
jgi:hypothetical protein